jgi:NTE family protein
MEATPEPYHTTSEARGMSPVEMIDGPGDDSPRDSGQQHSAVPLPRAGYRLALQGGGALGAFTAGVLDRLLAEREFRFDAVSGSSAGAMNAVVMASGLMAGGPAGARAALEQFWRRVGQLPSPWRALDFWLDGTPWDLRSSAMGLLSFVTPAQLNPFGYNPLAYNPLGAIVSELVDFAALRRPEAPRIHIAATDVETGRARIFTNHELAIEPVLASACLPHLFPTVMIDGRAYWDGGFSANPPIAPLLDARSDAAVLLVLVSPLERSLDGAGPPRSHDAISGRISDITANAALLRDIAMVERLETIALADGPEAASAKLNNDPSFVADLRRRGQAAAASWLAGQAHAAGLQRASAQAAAARRRRWWRSIAGALGPALPPAQWLKARLARLR